MRLPEALLPRICPDVTQMDALDMR